MPRISFWAAVVFLGFVGAIVAHAEVSPADPAISIRSNASPDGVTTLDFEWDLSRKNVIIGRVRFEFFKSPTSVDDISTLFVAPTFTGQIILPKDYKYVSVDGGSRVRIPEGNSQLLIHGKVRTSLTNDFMWGLGSPRIYKIQDARPEFLPWAPASHQNK